VRRKPSAAPSFRSARLGKPKGDTGRRLTADERRKLKKHREKDARRKKRDGRG
jgi:hypothetical protein